jgi:anaerobic magnesium-protoporphyrin IX monomethyl ester cyclase
MLDLGLRQVQLAAVLDGRWPWRIVDGNVLACRFPTQQDYRTPAWVKALLSNLAHWRYASLRYDNPWELAIAQKFIRLRDAKTQSL